MNKGSYIVVEGAEGVGKSTMVSMLASKLQEEGHAVRIMREPDSQNDLTARAIRRLTQDPMYPMNTRTEVLLYNAARSQSLEVIRNTVGNGVTCLVDRSFLTTLAIQYYGRGDVTDYQRINEIINFAVADMQPDLMLVLDAPVTTLRQRVSSRYASERFDNLDESFLERVRAGYLWEAKQRGYPVIYATDDVDTVFNNVWQHITQALSLRQGSSDKPQSVGEVLADKQVQAASSEPPVLLNEAIKTDTAAEAVQSASTEPGKSKPLITRTESGATIPTAAGMQELAKIVTNSTGNVYGFTEEISPVTVAAAMARLSRRGDDMRVTLLDEFVGKMEKDEQLLHRVITAYGDDSVQQLVGLHMVVENASNLLTKKLEWGRLASYLEQSTRYIYFDQKDENNHYRYFVPTQLKGKVRSQYIKGMNQLFDTYSDMVKQLTAYVRKNSETPKEEQDGAWKGATKAQACDAIRPVLPVATKSTVGIFASGQALESLIMHLQSDELIEAKQTGDDMLAEARKVTPVFFERADKPERGGAMVAYRANTTSLVKKLVNELLPPNHASETQAVRLVDYTPHNELDIVADMLYEQSDLPLNELQQIVRGWPYQQKVDVFNAYMGERLNRRHRPGRALEKVHYSWDLVCDYGIFRDLQRHRMVDDMEWQALTPRYGYDTPKLVEEAGLSDMFDKCFDISLELYSTLQCAGFGLEAQYATLLGHKMRWKVTYNAREAFHLHELRTSPQGHPGYRKLVLEMHEKLAEVHPLMASAMKFVNTGEDEKLTRLAAERYTQFKLDQLSKPE